MLPPVIAIAQVVDGAHLLRAAALPHRHGRQRAGQLDRMIHQIAADRVGAVRNTVGIPFAARHQQQLRSLDRMGGDDDMARAQRRLAAVRPADQNPADQAVRGDVDPHRDRLGENAGAGRLRLSYVHGGVVLGLHRADRNARRTGAAGRPVVVGLRISGLRRDPHAEARAARWPDPSAGRRASPAIPAWGTGSGVAIRAGRRGPRRPVRIRPRRTTARVPHRSAASRRRRHSGCAVRSRAAEDGARCRANARSCRRPAADRCCGRDRARPAGCRCRRWWSGFPHRAGWDTALPAPGWPLARNARPPHRVRLPARPRPPSRANRHSPGATRSAHRQRRRRRSGHRSPRPKVRPSEVRRRGRPTLRSTIAGRRRTDRSRPPATSGSCHSFACRTIRRS